MLFKTATPKQIRRLAFLTPCKRGYLRPRKTSRILHGRTKTQSPRRTTSMPNRPKQCGSSTELMSRLRWWLQNCRRQKPPQNGATTPGNKSCWRRTDLRPSCGPERMRKQRRLPASTRQRRRSWTSRLRLKKSARGSRLDGVKRCRPWSGCERDLTKTSRRQRESASLRSVVQC